MLLTSVMATFSAMGGSGWKYRGVSKLDFAPPVGSIPQASIVLIDCAVFPLLWFGCTIAYSKFPIGYPNFAAFDFEYSSEMAPFSGMLLNAATSSAMLTGVGPTKFLSPF